MWVCKNKCIWSGMPLCVACTIGVLGGLDTQPHAATLLQDGRVCDKPPGEGGDVIGTIKSFEGFVCINDSDGTKKSFDPGDPVPCPVCTKPLKWVEPKLEPKPKVKVVKAVKTIEPTAQDLKALNYINKYMSDHAYPPTIREIMVACEYSSSSSAFRGRERLVAAGVIKIVKGAARGIQGLSCQQADALGPVYAQDAPPAAPFKAPLFLFKKVMQTWQEAVENKQVDPTKNGGGVCLIVPKKGFKPGDGSNQILWFANASKAIAFEKDVLNSS